MVLWRDYPTNAVWLVSIIRVGMSVECCEVYLCHNEIVNIFVRPGHWYIRVITGRFIVWLRGQEHLRVAKGILGCTGVQKAGVDASQNGSLTLSSSGRIKHMLESLS